MSLEQTVFVGVMVAVAALVLAGAFVASRALSKASQALQQADLRMSATATRMPAQAADVRARIAEVDKHAERVLWQLGELDTRMDVAAVNLRASRAASDTLRVRLVEGRLTIARIRQLVRLLMRLGELRRDFL
jgi:hypothetical protein